MTERIDLGDLMREHPPARTVVLDFDALMESGITFGEWEAILSGAGVSLLDLERKVKAGGAEALGLAKRIAWAIARRAEPDLTLESVDAWGVEWRDGNAPAPDPTPAAPSGTETSS